jgi:hypothetical protein
MLGSAGRGWPMQHTVAARGTLWWVLTVKPCGQVYGDRDNNGRRCCPAYPFAAPDLAGWLR